MSMKTPSIGRLSMFVCIAGLAMPGTGCKSKSQSTDPPTPGDSALGDGSSAGDPTGGGKKKDDGFCFIATAAHGSYLAPDVVALRGFRDEYLLTNGPGEMFVELYYAYSPPLAAFISDSEALRTLTRWVLTPLVWGVNYPMTSIGAVLLLLLGIVLRQRRGPSRILRLSRHDG